MIPFKPKAARAALFPAMLAGVAFTATPAFAQRVPVDQISVKALFEMREILETKDSFTANEQKVSSNLVLATRKALAQPIAGSNGIIDRTNITAGMATIQIKAKALNTVEALIAANGGTVIETCKPYKQITAQVPLTALPTLAASPSVLTIDEPDAFTTNVGAVTSQGYVSHQAKPVVENLGVDGTGIKVGVLSDSATATRVTALEASGDLPTNTVVLNPGTGEDEGCAIMEIVHDLAPGAQLYFNTGTTAATFATAITTLAANGCTVIVDDISFYTEGVFQDDVIAQAINTFVANGGIYFSSAANSGNLDSGTAGCWEGDFLSGGTVASPISTTDSAPSLIHNFGTAANPVYYDTLTVASTEITLKWSDPLTGGTDDYDLFVLDPTGTTVVASSHARQTGARAPVESVAGTFAIGDRIVIVQYNTATKTTATRALHLDTNRGSLSIATRGSTFGHNAAASVQTMAATFWNSAKRGTVPFDGKDNPVELFSSDGPRAIFYTPPTATNPTGTQIGAGAPTFASLAAGTAGQSLAKPDFTAADGVTCKTTGFSPFFGTSAAGPHGAAIAALMMQAKPGITNTQIHNILASTALDNGAAGFDPDGGVGVLNALAAVRAAQALP